MTFWFSPFVSLLALVVLSSCASASKVPGSISTPSDALRRANDVTSSPSAPSRQLQPASPASQSESPLSPKPVATTDVSELDPTRLAPVEVARTKNLAQYTTLSILGSGSPGASAYTPETLWFRADTGRARASSVLVLWSDPGLANAQIIQIEGQDVATIGISKAHRIIQHAPEPLHFTIRKRGGPTQIVEVYTTTREPVATRSVEPPRPNYVHAP